MICVVCGRWVLDLDDIKQDSAYTMTMITGCRLGGRKIHLTRCTELKSVDQGGREQLEPHPRGLLRTHPHGNLEARCVWIRRERSCNLSKDGLVLALGTEVASEALAQTSGVVADTTAGAVAALLVTVAKEDIRAGRALLERAVRATEAHVTDAANMLHSIPRGSVRLAGLSSELLLGVADTTTGAVIRAHGTLTANAIVVVEALALAGLAVADALVGALNLRVGLVSSSGDSNPSSSLRAGAEGAVVLGPCSVAVRASVAHALVVGRARAVAGAAVGAVRRGEGSEASKSSEKKSAGHCDYLWERTVRRNSEYSQLKHNA